MKILTLPFILILFFTISPHCIATQESNEKRERRLNSADQEEGLSDEVEASNEQENDIRKNSDAGTDLNSNALLVTNKDGEKEEDEDKISEYDTSFVTKLPFPTPEPFRFEREAHESANSRENKASIAADEDEQLIGKMESNSDGIKYPSRDAALEKKPDNDELLPDQIAEAPLEYSAMEESSLPTEDYRQEQDLNDYAPETSEIFVEPTAFIQSPRNDATHSNQFSTESILQAIFAQNMNILKRTITKERVEINGSITVINQEEDIYYVESVLTLTSETSKPRVFFSQSNVGLTNNTKETGTRCEYSNGGTFYYDPIQFLHYPVHMQTAVDDSKFDQFGLYRKLKKLYFNCPLYQKCCELDCCQLSDKEIIAKKFRLSAALDEKTSTYVLPQNIIIKHKGEKYQYKLVNSVEYNIVSYKILDESTILTQCEYKFSESKEKIFDHFITEDGEVIESIFETYTAEASCTLNGICCGILCCKALPSIYQPQQPLQRTTEADPTVAIEEAPRPAWLAAASLVGFVGGIFLVSAVIVACIFVSKKIARSARSYRKHKRNNRSPYVA